MQGGPGLGANLRGPCELAPQDGPPKGPDRSPRGPLIPASGVLGAPGWGMQTQVLPGALKMARHGRGQQLRPGDVSRSRTSQPCSSLVSYHENSSLTRQP